MTLRQTTTGATTAPSSSPPLASYMPEVDKQDDRASITSNHGTAPPFETSDTEPSRRICQNLLTSTQELVFSHRRQQKRIVALQKQDRASKIKIKSLKEENARLKEALRRSTNTAHPTDSHHASFTLSSHGSKSKVPYGFQVRPQSPDRAVSGNRRTSRKAQENQTASRATMNFEDPILIPAEHRDLAPADVPRKVPCGFQVRAPSDSKAAPDGRVPQARTAKRPTASHKAVDSKHHTPPDGRNAAKRAVNRNPTEQTPGSQPKAVPYGFNVRARSDEKLAPDAFTDPAQALTKKLATGERIVSVRAKIEERIGEKAASEQRAMVRAMIDDWKARH